MPFLSLWPLKSCTLQASPYQSYGLLSKPFLLASPLLSGSEPNLSGSMRFFPVGLYFPIRSMALRSFARPTSSFLSHPFPLASPIQCVALNVSVLLSDEVLSHWPLQYPTLRSRPLPAVPVGHAVSLLCAPIRCPPALCNPVRFHPIRYDAFRSHWPRLFLTSLSLTRLSFASLSNPILSHWPLRCYPMPLLCLPFRCESFQASPIGLSIAIRAAPLRSNPCRSTPVHCFAIPLASPLHFQSCPVILSLPRICRF